MISARDVVRPVGDLLSGLLDVGRRHRRSWVTNGRAHIEVRGAQRAAAGPMLGHLESALQRLRGVDWAEANAVTGRLVVAFDGDAVGLEDLIEVIEGVEHAHDVHREHFPADRGDHPGDHEPLHRNMVALGADLMGLGLSAMGQLMRLTPLPIELASLVSVVDATPRLRRFVDERLGPAGDLGLALVNAATQGLTQGPLGLVVDVGHRAGLVTEVAARNRSWDRRETELVGHGRIEPAGDDRRPVPVPPGPIERYVDRVSIVSLGAFGLGWITSGDPRRAADLLIAGLPKAARLGREAFAAQLGRSIADRGSVIMNAGVFRRLDRIDTVILDASVLTSGALSIGRSVALDERSTAQVRRQAELLFTPEGVEALRWSEEWALGPFDELGIAIPPAAQPVIDGLRPGSHSVLGLALKGRLVGAVAVVAELDPLARQLVDAARDSGLTIVVAGARSARETVGVQLGADRLVAGGSRLSASIRRLQSDGHVVALVAQGPARALRASDCGIGLMAPGRRPPWGADLIIGPGLGSAIIVVGACRTARDVSRTSVQLALGGSFVGAAMALTAPLLMAGRRASLAVNGAALASLTHGAWTGWTIARRPTPVAVAPVAWHALPSDDVLPRLGTSLRGLSHAEAARRRRDPAADTDALGASTSFLQALGHELSNPLTPLLGAGAALSAAVGSFVDAGLVGAVTGLNAVVGAGQRVRTERSLQHLVEASSAQLTVTRDGHKQEIPVDEVVVGDIIHLSTGEVVPADCRILEADDLEVDESAVTGESHPVPKDVDPQPAGAAPFERHSMLFDDTTISAGTVTAVAVAIGRATEAGRALAAAADPPASGVETRLRDLIRVTVPVTLASGAATTALGVMRGRPLRTALQAGVSLTVAAVPEGLPLLATVAQSASARRLSAHNALVRNPRTIEALGRVDLLCFDKTGTLTEGRLSLQQVSDGIAENDLTRLGARHRRVLAAALRATPTPDDKETLPHATDRAVADGASSAGVSRLFRAEGWSDIEEFPFDSERQFHAVVGYTDDGPRVAVKGAPEVIVPRCCTWTSPDGRVPLDAARRSQLEDHVNRLARQGFRVLAVAEGNCVPASDTDALADLELLGFLALADPARPSAAAAIEGLRAAGVDVAMITGDHASTAEAIAAELGILNGGRILTGPDLDELDDHQLTEALASAVVFARVTPAHKVRIVEGFQRRGRVVAMTGDGANDAAAIRLAHVGIALGNRSGMAAREAADVVVTDDRIETIIQAIIEGRAMWASVRDALAILIGGNLGEVAFTLAATGLTGDSPLNARQLLLVNLLTDLLPAMAIALRPPTKASPEVLLHEGPEASLGAALERQIVLRAITTAAGASGGWLFARSTGTPRRARTIGLVALVSTQLGQTVVAGGRSPVVLASTAASAAALAAIVQTPIVSQFFGCTPLDPLGWVTGVGAASAATAGSVIIPWLARQGDVARGRSARGTEHSSEATIINLFPVATVER